MVNFARTVNYQQSAIVHCQNQLNHYMHELNNKKREEEKGKEERWREWMEQLDERLRRRREGQRGQGEGRITISYDTNFMAAILVTVNFDL